MLPPGNALPAASPLVVVLLMLVAGASAFASWQAHTEPPQASHGTAAFAMARSGESGLSSMTSMPASPERSGSDSLPLSNGADGEQDGTGDASEVLAIVAFWVLLMRDGGLLSTFWDGPAKPASLCCSALERPG
jgi:fructose-1,6-bisphosphatase/inositol monophosphatase family enzyme